MPRQGIVAILSTSKLDDRQTMSTKKANVQANPNSYFKHCINELGTRFDNLDCVRSYYDYQPFCYLLLVGEHFKKVCHHQR